MPHKNNNDNDNDNESDNTSNMQLQHLTFVGLGQKIYYSTR